jgi:hypothetical protein
MKIERIGLVFSSNQGSIKRFIDKTPFFTNEDLVATHYSENVEFIISIIKNFSVKNIDYLACNTLNYPNWEYYYTILTKETGVIVGASNDKTGNIKYGGDWIMENTSEDIESVYLTKSIEYYSYLLDNTYTVWASGLNYQPSSMIINGGIMYVLSATTGFISTINFADGVILNQDFTTGLINPGSLIIDGQYIYTGQISNGSFIQILLSSGVVNNTDWASQPLNFPNGLFINGNSMYTANNYPSGPISQIDLASGSVTNYSWSVALPSPYLMVVNGDYIYVLNNDSNSTISQLNLSDGTLVNNWTTGIDTPSGIAIYGDYIYVTNFYGKSIVQLNLSDGTIANSNWASSLYEPTGIVINDNTMYVACNPNPVGGNDYQIVTFTPTPTPTPTPAPTPTPTPIANICFPAGTPIQTDQGIISIEKINSDIHTINKNSIVDITKTITTDKYLIGFKKNALGLNYPNNFTLMSQDHKLYYNGKMREAKTFLGKFRNVGKVKYNGEILYNVLMEDYSHMRVNNLICETLNPNNIIAKLYTKKCKYTDDVRDKIMVLLKECIKKKDYKMYNKIIEHS